VAGLFDRLTRGGQEGVTPFWSYVESSRYDEHGPSPSWIGRPNTGLWQQTPRHSAVDQIRSLVFLDAFVPEDGQSHMALFPAEHAQLMRQDARQNGDGYMLTPPTAERVNLNAADVAWANALCGKHPLACFEQKVALSGARERVARRTYIVATGWPSPFETFAKRFEQDPAWQVKRVDCGHLIMLDRPQELANILLTTA
jgi:hypothetical protein